MTVIPLETALMQRVNTEPLGLILIGEEDQIIDLNLAARRLLGVGSPVIRLTSLRPFFPRWDTTLDLVFSGASTTTQTTHVFRFDGSSFPAQYRCVTLELEHQTLRLLYFREESLSSFGEEPTDERFRQLELTVEARTRELGRTLQVLEIINGRLESTTNQQKAILDNVGVMLFLMDTEGKILFFNPESMRLTGYHESEVIHQHTPLLFMVREDIQHCRTEMKERYGVEIADDFDVIRYKALKKELREIECHFITKFGGTVPVSFSIIPLINSKSQLTGFIGTAMDISVRKKAEAELLETLNKERQLVELKSRFVSMASHEFRTPLSTILSSAYLAQMYAREAEQPKREGHLSRIVSSVNLLNSILNEFLSLGRIEEQGIQLQVTQFDLKAHVLNILDEMKTQLRNGQHWDYHHIGEVEVSCDPVLIHQIVTNLLSNAIKFSPEQSPIGIHTENGPEGFRIRVEDHGIGIPEEDREHLTKRFFRGSNATHIQGTGLGLHIVSCYLEKLGGSITIIPAAGPGTCIEVNIPQTKTIAV